MIDREDVRSPDTRASGTGTTPHGLLPAGLSRRDFGKWLGARGALLSALPLAACGGGSDDAPPRVYPAATPIAGAVVQPTTVGSYQRITGYYAWSVAVGSASRDIEVYVPKGARQREYWIGIALPDGVQSQQFLGDAGWFDIADANSVCLLVMKPGAGGVWGDAATEQAYCTAAMATLVSSGTYYSALTYHYVVGYGAGAGPLQLFAASNPLSMIAQVYVDATADAGYAALLTAAGSTQVRATPQPNNMDFTGYTDINGNPVTQQRTFAAQYYRDVPIPVWFVGTAPSALLSYWAGVNDCQVVPVSDDTYGQVYLQDKSVSNAIATRGSAVQAQVASRTGTFAANDAVLTRNIHAFLAQYSGYDNNSVYGHFITRRLDYKAAIAAGRMIVRDYAWSGNTTTPQTYIVYVPESVKKAYSTTKPAPVVFCTHGAGQTAFVFMEATDVKEAAEKYGFVAVTYDNTSVAFMQDLVGLVKQDCLTLGVAADPTRFYAYGQSAGGGAVTSFSRDATLAGTFAAFAATSAVWSAPASGASTTLVPFYAIYGEYDYWPQKFGPVGAGDFRGSTNTQATTTASGQDYWLNRLIGRTLAQEVATPTYVLTDGLSASLVPQNTSINLILKPTTTANRYVLRTWKRNGVPLYTFGQCFGKGHNNLADNLDKLWEELFAKWQRGSQAGQLLYWENGIGVGTATSVRQA